MGRYGSVDIAAPASRVTAVVQSANPADLQQRIAAALAAIPAGYLVVDISLAGAGEGHTFTVTIEAGLAADVTGGFSATPAVRCYLGADAAALVAARNAVSEAGLVLADSQVTGSASGTRFMGLLVYGDVASGVEPAPGVPAVQRIGSGNVVAPDSTLIGLSTVGLDNGTVVFVAREGASFELVRDPNAALIAALDGITVVQPTAPVGTELWVRIPGTSRAFAYEAAWFVDAATGDDDNDGLTVGTALASMSELCRRLSGLRIPQNVVVTIAAGDYTAQPVALDLELPTGVSVLLQGAFTSEDDVSAAILPTVMGDPITNANAQRGAITATAASFTRLQRLRITDGASVGAVAWVTDVPTPGAGGVAQVTRWGVMTPTTGTLVTERVPVTGAAFAIDTLQTLLGAPLVNVRGPGRVVFADAHIRPPSTAYRITNDSLNVAGVLFYRCRVDCSTATVFYQSQGSATLSLMTSTAGTVAFSRSSLILRMCVFMRDGATRLTVRMSDVSVVTQTSSVQFARASVELSNNALWDQISATGNNDAIWVDGTGASAAEIAQGGTWWAHSTGERMWGLDNTFSGSTFLVSMGTLRYNSNATPSVPGGATDVQMGSATFAYAALPAGIDVAGSGAGAIVSN